jgi:single-stranded-DNA-specific exonuclease
MGHIKQMPSPAGMQKTEWVVPPADGRAEELAKSLRVSPLIAQLLINRGIVEAREGSVFLQPKLTELIRPAQMPGIGPAVARVRRGQDKK